MSNRAYIFQSERLGFRKWIESDRALFASLNADPVVMEFFPAPLTSSETDQFIERIEKQFDDYGYGLYAVDSFEDNSFIGFIGLSHPRFESPFTPCVEIGWRLAKEYWNRGFATEGAAACLEYGFSVLGLDEILSFTATHNTRSENVMKKIGMQKIGEFDHPALPGSWLERHVLYQKQKD
ncbi:MAG TPA: GNAT family N-acetyltransferase [Candidatus Kapabacteria bacterium]|nr:GNAT family N-acetyltransferase [Candidatus Kapabacteria bacterium]